MAEQYNYACPLCVGLAGGIATPAATAAAFALGAAYVLTGSINQACIEAGTSETVRHMLADARLGRQWLSEFRASMPEATASSDIPEDLRRQLESLGYLGGEDEE